MALCSFESPSTLLSAFSTRSRGSTSSFINLVAFKGNGELVWARRKGAITTTATNIHNPSYAASAQRKERNDSFQDPHVLLAFSFSLLLMESLAFFYSLSTKMRHGIQKRRKGAVVSVRSRCVIDHQNPFSIFVFRAN